MNRTNTNINNKTNYIHDIYNNIFNYDTNANK